MPWRMSTFPQEAGTAFPHLALLQSDPSYWPEFKGLGWRSGADLEQYMHHLLSLYRKPFIVSRQRETVFLCHIKEACFGWPGELRIGGQRFLGASNQCLYPKSQVPTLLLVGPRVWHRRPKAVHSVSFTALLLLSSDLGTDFQCSLSWGCRR